MATKRRKNPTANETLKAPIGARQLLACTLHHFCDFSWLKTLSLLFGCIALGSITALAQPAAQKLIPNLESNIERPLRYRPDGADFVIENGAEFFNRPLYGGNTAFRVDGGDKPEFVLYLPGRGGNLRLAVRQVERVVPNALASSQRLEGKPLHRAKWLHDAASITTRYRPGSLLYEIRDPLLGPAGVINLTALACHQTEGLIVRLEAAGLAPGLELVWAYGGVNGQRGSRDGDIGTERVPISQWFQLSPDFAQDNTIELTPESFTVRAKPATITGLVPAGARLTTADASQWNDLPALLKPGRDSFSSQPIVVGRVALANNAPLYLSLQRQPTGAVTADLDTYKEVGAPPVGASLDDARGRAPGAPLQVFDLPRLFAETEAYFAALRTRVSVETPDPFINAAVGALNVAADAVWDEPQQAIMHGAIAWRTKLLGWRGPYALDALGWHDRARANLTYWAGRQNTDPIPDKLPPPDANANLARSETALHSNGDLSKSHYDMNLVFIDGLFRHLLWTGDIEFAKKMWPVIERHLAWERRLFRREFTTATGEKLPLYEAYAVIWASDDLQYSGGGTAHASAYNYWHNRMAARLAPLTDADPAPYTKEADLIARGMRELLWQKDIGIFAESKDWLGHQLVHSNAAVWSFYHTLDSEVPTPAEAAAMTRYVESQIPHLPVRGLGVPEGLHVVATSNWMPYTWSINNVTMNENAHTALGFWQAGRAEEAFTLLKGSLVASMFMGISPGNVGTMNYLDVYRRESQRDFGDGSGVLSRALVEGLFGVRPDALAGELLIAPGFPSEWDRAQLHHPQVDLTYVRKERVETFTVTPRFTQPMRLRLLLPMLGTLADVTINGTPMSMFAVEGSAPMVEITPPTAASYSIVISWRGSQPEKDSLIDPIDLAFPDPPRASHTPPQGAIFQALSLSGKFNGRVTEIFQKDKYLSPRSPFVSLALPSQGIGYWAGHVNATAEIDDTGLRAVSAANGGKLTLPNGVSFAIPWSGDAKNILFTSQWDNYPSEATVPLTGKARQLHLLMAGSTNAMQSRLDNGEVVVTYTDGTTSRLALRNPETWWPIEQDYFVDDYQFRLISGANYPSRIADSFPLPVRIDLKTGQTRVLDAATFKGQGRVVTGGAATVLELALDPDKELQSLTVRALANDVVIGLMAATLAR
jgi:hypothetical protein